MASTENEEDREVTFEEAISTATNLSELLQILRDREQNFLSPVNLNLTFMKEIHLSELEWHHYEIPPKKVKLNNSGHTIILSAKWFQERPFLTGGPLIGNYVFSQMHFHWGSNDMEGSEHMADGVQYPLEMHVVHFKSSYLTQETALFEQDGVTVIVFLFKLQSQENTSLRSLFDYFSEIQKAFTSLKLQVIPINTYFRPFKNDYFIYWGNINTKNKAHLILWIICREPIGISAEQVEIFRTFLDENEEPLLQNFRTIHTADKAIYHVNPSCSKYSTLLPIPREPRVSKPKHNTTKE